MGKQLDDGDEHGEDCIGDGDGRKEGRQGLAEQELFAADRGGQQRFQGPLYALADHGVGGQGRRYQRGIASR